MKNTNVYESARAYRALALLSEAKPWRYSPSAVPVNVPLLEVESASAQLQKMKEMREVDTGMEHA